MLPILFLFAFNIVEAQSSGSAGPKFFVPAENPEAYYKIECKIDTSLKRLSGTEIISIPADAIKRTSHLALSWAINSSHSIKISIDGKPVSVLGDSGQVPICSPLVFEIPGKLSGKGKLNIKIDFSKSVAPIKMGEYTLLTDWFPELNWGFSTHSNFDVKIDIPSDYVIGTSGLFNKKTGYYHVDNARSFGLFLGKGLKVAEEKAGDVLVRCLYSAKGEECAQLVLKTAVDAINFYTKYFGFYPYKSWTVVPGYTEPWGGYNAATSISVIHGEEKMSKRPLIHWQWITAHEIGHMYWGEYVIDKNSPEWLWIGLGIYADREFIRSRGLSLKQHKGLVDEYIKGVMAHNNTTIAITQEQLSDIDFDFNNIVIHGKGFSMISALANYLGKDTFCRIYKRALSTFGGKRMDLSDFQKICEEESRENLEWFFEQWARSNKFLSYKVSSQKCTGDNGKYTSTVNVECLGTLKMPIPVVAYFSDGTSQRQSTDRLLDINSLVFKSTSPLKNATIDPDSELVMITTPPKLTVEELNKKVNSLPWEQVGTEPVSLFSTAMELKPTDSHLWYRLGLALYDAEFYDKSLEAFKQAIEVSHDSTDDSYLSHAWQGHIYDILKNRESAIAQYKASLKMCPDKQWNFSQYDITLDKKWLEERLITPFVR